MQELERLLHLFATTEHGPALYGVVALAAALDAVLPLVPSETILITAAVLSTRPAGPALWLLIAAGAAGAIAGDNAAYWLGRILGERAVRRLVRGRRGAERVQWATVEIERHGPALVVAARYIPGGRTAVTLAAGTLAMPWPRFMIADVFAGLTWATWASLLGRLGGAVFEGTWTAILLSAATAVAVGLVAEAVRRLRHRIKRE